MEPIETVANYATDWFCQFSLFCMHSCLGCELVYQKELSILGQPFIDYPWEVYILWPFLIAYLEAEAL